MRKLLNILNILKIICFFLVFPNMGYSQNLKPDEFLVISYHNIPQWAHPNDSYGISQHVFIEQMEYLRTHGYHPVSIDDIILASKGKKTLPERSVLLTFDDGYISYYTFVVPVLKSFGYPSVLAVVGHLIDKPPKNLPEPLMTWDQIEQICKTDLVEVVSHTYDLHKAIQYNPQGNVGPAATVRAYDPEKKTYETNQEYRERITADFVKQKILFEKKIGVVPRAVVWPYGKFNQITVEVAKEQGCPLTFTLEEGLADVNQLQTVNRIMAENPNIEGNISIRDFIKQVKTAGEDTTFIRAAQVDLDMIYDPGSYEQTDWNLGRLIDRLVALKVNTVFLQAFSDQKGTGNIESVYFNNRVLPVKGDIFSHAVHQMAIRDMKVYAWMPTISVVLPDKGLNERLRVRENRDGQIRLSQSWYKRLSPFSHNVRASMLMLYEDLAAHNQIDGVLFQDDAYLTDMEDYHPTALQSYKKAFGKNISPAVLENDSELKRDWVKYKTDVLIDFTKTLQEKVRRYRPNARFARNLYALVLTNPQSESWFAQNYEKFLQSYDQVVVMAYPRMESIKRPSRWFEKLIHKAGKFAQGLDKTVFKVQTYDWNKKAWIKDSTIRAWIREILAAGGRHVAYYPDNLWIDKPKLAEIKLEMSTRDFPFLP